MNRHIWRCLLTGALALWCSACDMPPPEPVEPPVPAHLSAAPWITAGYNLSLSASFVTDIPVQPGLRIENGPVKHVVRCATKGTRHTLRLPDLEPGRYECELVAERPVEANPFTFIVPSPLQQTTIAIMAGGWESPETLASVISALAGVHPDAVCIAGSPVAEREEIPAWEQDVIDPLRAAAPGAVIVRTPDFSRMRQDVASFVFPGVTPGENYAVNIGALHLALIAPEYLTPERMPALIQWLRADMQGSGSRFRAVLLPESLIDADTAEMSEPLLDVLGPVFEETRVALVLGTGDSFYHRAHPIGETGRAVRYINLCSLDRKRNAKVKEMPETAALSAYEGSLLLTVGGDGLSGIFRSTSGETLDQFAINTGHDEEPARARAEMIGRRTRESELRREMRSVLRQCFRAVPDPKNPGAAVFVVYNPGVQTLEGALQFDDTGAVFGVTPRQLTFSLPPKGFSRSTVRLAPQGGTSLPKVNVRLGNLEASTPLVFTAERVCDLPRTDETMRIDGAYPEPAWQDSVNPGELVRLDGRRVDEPVMATRALATRTGLCLGFRYKALGAKKVAAAKRDDPVWRDSSVELFIDTEGQARHFCHFGLAENGVAFDANDREGPAWNPDWTHAFRREGEYVHVEVLIPYAALGLSAAPAPGDTWRVNITRNIPSASGLDVYQLAPTHGSNDRCGAYALFRFR